MASPSKEENILRLILENSPLKEWHFEEMMREAKITRLVANKWLKKYVSEGLLMRVKNRKRFPHYVVGENNPYYYSLKRVYALNMLHKSGLIPKLMAQKTAKTIILFGSIAKGDWYKDSDIDIFVFGNLPDFDRKFYERRLDKSIEIHLFKDRSEIRKLKTGLMQNIINGYIIKGQVQDIVEVA